MPLHYGTVRLEGFQRYDMITDDEIVAKAKEFDVSPHDVERDYVHSWLLKGIYEDTYLANRLFLKGGNGIRKAYLRNARYSKDLDFSCPEELDELRFFEALQNLLINAQQGSGVEFRLDRTRIGDKRLTIPGVKATEARVYFKGFFQEETVTLRSHLDIGELEKTLLPVQGRPLLHPYSDAENCRSTIRCHKLEEILASKLTTLLFRKKAQDLFDLIFAIFFTSEYTVSRSEIIRTFLKKSIYDPEAQQARLQLLSIPLASFAPLWSTLSLPSVSRFSFDAVVQRFAGLIDELFGLLAPQPSGGLRARPSAPYAFSFGGAFSVSNRSVIIDAGRGRRAIEATYHGVRRLIEPYKLEFKIRKKDNRGFEYFYGYDQTGGRSSPPGIKTFFCNELQNIVATDIAFTPRYPVEF